MRSTHRVSALEPKNPDFEQVVRQSFLNQRAMTTLGATLETVLPGMVTIRLPFDEKFTQQNGFLHAGIVTTVIDSACGYSAYTLVAVGSNILSVEFKVNLLAPAVGETFLATGRVVKAGKTLTICQGEMTAHESGEEKVVAIMTATMMVMRPKH